MNADKKKPFETPDWYFRWLEGHCKSIGADASVTELFVLNSRTLVEDWKATEDELLKCTRRLVCGNRVPKFNSEQSEAVGVELRELRAEERQKALPSSPYSDATPPVTCIACNGTGLAIVPHPKCISKGKLFCYPGYQKIFTVAVICDRPGCSAGRSVTDSELRVDDKKRRPFLSAFEQKFNVDPLTLLREHDAEQLRQRQQDDSGEESFRPIGESILQKLEKAWNSRGA